MILVCSAGHEHDTSSVWHREDVPGQHCLELTEYDRLHGSTYCWRRLRVKPDTEQTVEKGEAESE